MRHGSTYPGVRRVLACGASYRLDDRPPSIFIRTMFKAANAVQIKVSLDEVTPDVWRRLVLPVHWNLEHLHLGVQAAFKRLQPEAALRAEDDRLTDEEMEPSPLSLGRRSMPVALHNCLADQAAAFRAMELGIWKLHFPDSFIVSFAIKHSRIGIRLSAQHAQEPERILVWQPAAPPIQS